jgi:DNA-binding response OmpR family regulator
MEKGRVRVLVVDDESRYVWTIRMNLEARGYEVFVASNGHSALDLVASKEPDLVILDVKMPGMDGYAVCRRIREFSSVPIIMLLDTGADDYVTKPFSVEELMARVRAALRRTVLADQQRSVSVFRAGDLEIDFVQRRVYIGDQEIHLTPMEYRLLCELVQNAGRVLVPDYLLEKVWGIGYEGENLLLRQVIHRLRHKIERDPRHPRRIQTRPGSGYVFVSPEAA